MAHFIKCLDLLTKLQYFYFFPLFTINSEGNYTYSKELTKRESKNIFKSGGVLIVMAILFALTIGIAVQNIPEAIIVSAPIRSVGEEKSKSFLMGVVSGIIEPLIGILMLMIVTAFPGILLFAMSLAGGAIAFLVIEENIPSMNTGKHSDKGTISFAFFSCLMMLITFSNLV